MKKQKTSTNQPRQKFLLAFFNNLKESWQKTQQYLLSFKTKDDRQ
jgi:hypothetical protein